TLTATCSTRRDEVYLSPARYSRRASEGGSSRPYRERLRLIEGLKLKVSGRIYRRDSAGVCSDAQHYALSLFLSLVVGNKTNTKEENPMHPSIQLTTAINPTSRSPLRRGFLLIPLAFVFVCFGLSQTAQAVTPAPDGGYHRPIKQVEPMDFKL